MRPGLAGRWVFGSVSWDRGGARRNDDCGMMSDEAWTCGALGGWPVSPLKKPFWPRTGPRPARRRRGDSTDLLDWRSFPLVAARPNSAFPPTKHFSHGLLWRRHCGAGILPACGAGIPACSLKIVQASSLHHKIRPWKSCVFVVRASLPAAWRTCSLENVQAGSLHHKLSASLSAPEEAAG
jgi:hypothetical protein